MPCHEQHCHTESKDVRGEGSLIPAPETFRCYIVRRTTVAVFSGGESKAEVAQNSAAAVGAKDDVGGFDIVVEDLSYHREARIKKQAVYRIRLIGPGHSFLSAFDIIKYPGLDEPSALWTQTIDWGGYQGGA